jgi:hypothetical protein
MRRGGAAPYAWRESFRRSRGASATPGRWGTPGRAAWRREASLGLNQAKAAVLSPGVDAPTQEWGLFRTVNWTLNAENRPRTRATMQSDWHEDPEQVGLENTMKETIPMTRPQMAPAHNGHMGLEAVAELRRLARSQPKSGHEAMAKDSAIRTLERMSRGRRRRRCRQCRRAGIRMTLGIRTTSLIGCLHEHPQILQRHWEAAWREGWL